MHTPVSKYTPPMLVALGSMAALTQGNAGGSSLDKSFPIHTPKKDLTFS
jgi:hypothetical protein